MSLRITIAVEIIFTVPDNYQEVTGLRKFKDKGRKLWISDLRLKDLSSSANKGENISILCNPLVYGGPCAGQLFKRFL